MKNWLGMTAAELGRGIENGSIDPVTLTETYLAAIEAHPLKDRIYARVTADRARAEAEMGPAFVFSLGWTLTRAIRCYFAFASVVLPCCVALPMPSKS